MVSDLLDILAAQEWAFEADPPSAFRMIAGLGWVRTQFGHFDQLRRQAEWLLAQDRDEHPELWAHAVAAPVRRRRLAGARSTWSTCSTTRSSPCPRTPTGPAASPTTSAAWAAAVQRGRRRQDVPARRGSRCRRRRPRRPELRRRCLAAARLVGAVRTGARRCSPACDRALDRHGQRLGAATGLLTYSIQIELAIWEGRFDDAAPCSRRTCRSTCPSSPPPPSPWRCSETPPVIARCSSWPKHGSSTGRSIRSSHRPPSPSATSAPRSDGRLSDAADLADEAWQLLEAVRGVRSWGLIDAVVSGLAVGRIERARRARRRLRHRRRDVRCATVPRGDAAAVPVPAGDGDRTDDDALDAAHELVEHAHATGLALLTVDTLETIARSCTGATRPCRPPVCSARAPQPATPSATAGATRHTPSSSTRSSANSPPTTPTPSPKVGRSASTTPSSTPDARTRSSRPAEPRLAQPDADRAPCHGTRRQRPHQRPGRRAAADEPDHGEDPPDPRVHEVRRDQPDRARRRLRQPSLTTTLVCGQGPKDRRRARRREDHRTSLRDAPHGCVEPSTSVSRNVTVAACNSNGS